jgi:hypothetical protein
MDDSDVSSREVEAHHAKDFGVSGDLRKMELPRIEMWAGDGRPPSAPVMYGTPPGSPRPGVSRVLVNPATPIIETKTHKFPAASTEEKWFVPSIADSASVEPASYKSENMSGALSAIWSDAGRAPRRPPREGTPSVTETETETRSDLPSLPFVPRLFSVPKMLPVLPVIRQRRKQTTTPTVRETWDRKKAYRAIGWGAGRITGMITGEDRSWRGVYRKRKRRVVKAQ